MAKDFSAFLGPKKKKNLNLTGPNSQSKAKKNLVQTENREVTTVSQPSPNRELTVSQPSPNRELTVSQPLAEGARLTGKNSQPLATPLADPSPNRELTVSQPLVEKLTGKKRVFVFWLFKIRHSTGEEKTGPIDNNTLLDLLGNRSSGALRNLLSQLKASGYISIYPLSMGRIGLRKFKLNDYVYREILALPEEIKTVTVSQPSPNRELTVSQPLATALVEGSSSSSYFNNNSTTTSDELWKTLDLSSVENFGINQSAIFEARQKFGPFSFVDFEKFLERFGKFMSDNKKSKGIGNARGFFFSLCKQIREGIEPLSEIKTDSDEALALLLKLKKEEKRKREEVERELIAFEFDEWFSDLSDKEKDVISPPTELLKKDSGPYKAVFRNHFEENLWPQIKSKMVQGEL